MELQLLSRRLCFAASALTALRVIVAFPPGGGTDIVARVLGQKLADSLGQPVVVENRTGASGNIGHALAVKSAPDGYTILLGSSNFVANPALLKNNPYDALKDFTPVTYAAGSPNTVVVHPSFQAHSFKEFLVFTKREDYNPLLALDFSFSNSYSSNSFSV